MWIVLNVYLVKQLSGMKIKVRTNHYWPRELCDIIIEIQNLLTRINPGNIV